ncbi:hypothetical protein [Kordiimonas pumila]|uniref:DUF2178 domain-containing protein n=1 Tax=Kordiimonas pumila TaxID=2161677 RepID=A0ABV7D8N7_9PROT|nr:hypothetical protein [Kordiimonas pumila]
MCFYEKSAIAALSLSVLVFGAYFVYVLTGLPTNGSMTLSVYVPYLVGVVVLFIILSIIMQVIITICTPKDEMDEAGKLDERDKLVINTGSSNASYILYTGIIAAIFALVYEMSDFWVAHILLGALVLSDIVRHVLVLFMYRRGM